MANLNESDEWFAGIYQLEEDDPVLGGPAGIDNLAPRQLASRALYQRLRNITPWAANFVYPAEVAYVSHAGTTWKSVAASTGVEPGSDQTKWTRWAFTEAELAGAVGNAVDSHEAKPDPHPQYATDADLTSHRNDTDPHQVYAPWGTIAPVIVASGAVPDRGATGQVLQAIRRLAGKPGRVLGLTGGNNAGAPSTQFDLKADAVVLRTPATGEAYTVAPVGTVTCNIASGGPAANGRDQAGAFAPSSWLHLYFIFNPTTSTVATIASASAPPNGPALPAGYTAWAYAGAVYFSSGSVIAAGRFKGSWFFYDAPQAAVNGGTSTAWVQANLSTLVPPNALQIELSAPNLAISASAAGGYALTCRIAYTGTLVAYEFGLQGQGGAGAVFGVAGPSKRIPNVGQNFAYQLVVNNGAGPIVTIVVPGFCIPNGGE